MKYFLLISLLLFLAGTHTTNFFGIAVKSAGTIRVSATWSNTDASPITFWYDAAGTPLSYPLINGDIYVSAGATGQILVYILFGTIPPTGFLFKMTMPNGDIYVMWNTFMTAGNSNSVDSTVCESDYTSLYLGKTSVPLCQPICRIYQDCGVPASPVSGDLCSTSLSACSLSCTVKSGCKNGVLDIGETCDSPDFIGCNSDCTVDPLY